MEKKFINIRHCKNKNNTYNIDCLREIKKLTNCNIVQDKYDKSKCRKELLQMDNFY